MTRAQAIANAETYYDSGTFYADLGRRVAIKTESQNPERKAELDRYLQQEMTPSLEALGFACKILPNPAGKGGPFLVAERIEDPGLATVLTYGHGDVIRGQETQWREGIGPWALKPEGDRVYGRGTADNKGQHTINIGAVAAALKARGKLGFNLKVLIETGEEIGSPGLREFCEQQKALLKADVLIASDGPRLRAQRPTIFLGSRVYVMTTRPCSLKKVVDVNLPRPRDYRVLASEQFRLLVKETEDAVHEEPQKAFEAGERELA